MVRQRFSGAHRGIASISASAGAGQIVTLLATPLLSRIYSPEAFGLFATLMAVVNIASTAGTLRLETAVPLASPPDARNLLKTSMWSSLVAGAICAALTYQWRPESLGESRALGLFIVSYLVWVTALYTVLTSYSLRFRNYSAVAKRNLLQQVGTAAGQLLVSPWTKSALGLTIGQTIGRSVGVAGVLRESHLLARQTGDRPSQIVSLRRYWRFPLVFMPSALLNVGATQIPLLLVASRYGTESAGNLSQAIKFGAVPAALLGGAVSSVVMAEMALSVRSGENDQRARYLKASKALGVLGGLWFLALVLVAPTALPLILGPEWASSGAYAAALAVAAAAGLVVSPLSVVFVLYEKSAMNIALDISRLVLVLGVGMAAWRMGYGPVAAVLAMSAAMGVIFAATWVIGLRIVSTPSSSAVTRDETGQSG